MKYESFREMPVWKKAMELSVEIQKTSASLPRCEDYGLTSQIRRSASSVRANIAEAFGRKTAKDKSHFYVNSRGSAYETQDHLLYGKNVGYFNEISELDNQYEQLIHDLNKIIKTLNNK